MSRKEGSGFRKNIESKKILKNNGSKIENKKPLDFTNFK